MLRIRPAQMNSMFEEMMNNFIEGVQQRLRSERSELIAHLSDDKAQAEIRKAVALARHYGFSIKSVVARFVILRLEQGESFDSLAEVRRLLLDATAGEKERITQTERYFVVAAPRE